MLAQTDEEGGREENERERDRIFYRKKRLKLEIWRKIGSTVEERGEGREREK